MTKIELQKHTVEILLDHTRSGCWNLSQSGRRREVSRHMHRWCQQTGPTHTCQICQTQLPATV